MPAVYDDAVCLRRWEWSETSQTVALLTRDHGVVRGLAKGARRYPSPFHGGFEPITIGQLGFFPRRTEGLSTVSAWDVHHPLPFVRRTAEGLLAALFAADLVARVIRPNVPHPALFEGMTAMLNALDAERTEGPESETRARGRSAILARFLWLVLDDTGHRPELERDVRTGEVIDAEQGRGGAGRRACFDPEAGGVTLVEGAGWPVGLATVAALRSVARRRSEGSSAAMSRAGRLLARFAEHRFEVGLPLAGAVFPDAGGLKLGGRDEGGAGGGR